MFKRLRSLSAKKKAGVAALLGGLWPVLRPALEEFVKWFVDKVYGEAAYNWLRAALDAMVGPAWQDVLWSWGPTLLLCGVGVYLLLRGDRPPRRPARPHDEEPQALSRATVLPRPPVQVAPTAEPDWSKLYELSDEGRRVRLRFLPDTEEHQGDTVLLVVLGYKVMKGDEQVHVRAVTAEAMRAMHEAPNSRVTPVLKTASLIRSLSQPLPDLGAAHVAHGLLRRVRLAEGGYYELTPAGEQRARTLALDLIQRA
jgi:hypothetical protein